MLCLINADAKVYWLHGRLKVWMLFQGKWAIPYFSGRINRFEKAKSCIHFQFEIGNITSLEGLSQKSYRQIYSEQNGPFGKISCLWNLNYVELYWRQEMCFVGALGKEMALQPCLIKFHFLFPCLMSTSPPELSGYFQNSSGQEQILNVFVCLILSCFVDPESRFLHELCAHLSAPPYFISIFYVGKNSAWIVSGGFFWVGTIVEFNLQIAISITN